MSLQNNDYNNARGKTNAAAQAPSKQRTVVRRGAAMPSTNAAHREQLINSQNNVQNNIQNAARRVKPVRKTRVGSVSACFGTDYPFTPSSWWDIETMLPYLDENTYVVLELDTDIMADSPVQFICGLQIVNNSGTRHIIDGSMLPPGSPMFEKTNDDGCFEIWDGVAIENCPEGAPALSAQGEVLIRGDIGHNHGGGLEYHGTKTVLVEGNGHFYENESENPGGAIHMFGGMLILNENALIEQNKTAAFGGGIAIDSDASLIMNDNSAVNQNDSDTLVVKPFTNPMTSLGGGIFCLGSFEMNGSATVDGNISYGNGAGIYWDGSANPVSTFAINGGTISNNDMGPYNSYTGGPLGGGGLSLANLSGKDVHIENATFSGNDYNGYGGAIGITKEDLRNLYVGAGVTFTGNKSKWYVPLNPLDLADYNSHVAATQFSNNYQYGWNSRDIQYVTLFAQFAPQVLKTIVPSGTTVTDGLFHFEVEDDSGNIVTTYHTDNLGRMRQDDPFYLFDEGTTTYTIRETDGVIPGWISSDDEFAIELTLTEIAGERNFDSVYTFPDGPVNFVNTVALKAGITASVVKMGAPLVAGEYSYTLYESDDTFAYDPSTDEIEEVDVDADGMVTFSELEFNVFGDYYFVVTRASSSTSAATDEFGVEVHLIELDGGYAQLIVDYPNGYPYFVEEAVPAASGNITFNDSFKFSEPGVYTYKIKETSTSGNGWTTDTTEYTVEITVTDDGMGHLTAALAYPDGFPNFQNTYQTSPATITLTGIKTITGAYSSLTDGQFSFGVFDDQDNLVGYAGNAADGSIEVSFEIDTPGSYNYVMRELTPNGEGWTVDTSEYDIQVVVTDDGLGTLSSTITYPGNDPANVVFANTYSAEPAKIHISAVKYAIGASLPAGKFQFTVRDKANPNNIRATGTNTAAQQKSIVHGGEEDRDRRVELHRGELVEPNFRLSRSRGLGR